MGYKLNEIYDYVERESGLVAVLRVILASGIYRTTALDQPDDPEKIATLRAAVKKVLNKSVIPV
jgi:hypothetical protein